MKALSIHPDWALMIWGKEKTVEVRSWKTNYRGDLLICSTQQKERHTMPGHALCVVRLTDCIPFEKSHMKAAGFREDEDFDYSDSEFYSWILDDLRYIVPIPLKGKLGLWNYDGEIEYLEESEDDEEDERMYHEYFEPIFIP